MEPSQIRGICQAIGFPPIADIPRRTGMLSSRCVVSASTDPSLAGDTVDEPVNNAEVGENAMYPGSGRL